MSITIRTVRRLQIKKNSNFFSFITMNVYGTGTVGYDLQSIFLNVNFRKKYE